MKNMIFLIGAARSGTKFLRNCFSECDEIEIVPYDIGYVWRYGNEKISHDELKPSDLDNKIKFWIRKTLPKMTIKKKHSKFIFEKTVSNSLRVSFIEKIFPNSKFIHIVRNGRDVIHSSTKQWSLPPNKNYLIQKIRYFPFSNYRYGLRFIWNLIYSKFMKLPTIWGPRYNGIDQDIKNLSIEGLCSKQWSRCVNVAEEQLNRIDNKRVYRISYERLILDINELKNVCKFIGINNSSDVLKYYKENVVIKNDNSNTFEDKLLQKAINKYANKTLKKLGYKI